jgi:hypothetical protein
MVNIVTAPLKTTFKTLNLDQVWYCTPVIPATGEAKVGRLPGKSRRLLHNRGQLKTN